MGKGRGASPGGTAATRRLPALIGTLAAGFLVATLLGSQLRQNTETSTTRGCGNDRRRRSHAQPQTLEGVRTGGVTCGREPHADVAWIQGPEGQAGGAHTCVGLERVCLDQGVIVMHDERYNMVNGSEMPTFDITDLEVRL
jgi:hypothetical protein